IPAFRSFPTRRSSDLFTRELWMLTFDRLMEPVLPILEEIEQERVPHFNETHAWPLFVRVLVYHFTMGFASMRELVTGLRHADPRSEEHTSELQSPDHL